MAERTQTPTMFLKSSSLQLLLLHNFYDIFSLVLEQLGSRWVNGGCGQFKQSFSYQAVGVKSDFDSPYATLTGSRESIMLVSQNRLPVHSLSDSKTCSLLHFSLSTTFYCNKNYHCYWFIPWHLKISTMNMLILLSKYHNIYKLLIIKLQCLPKLFLKQTSALCNIFPS